MSSLNLEAALAMQNAALAHAASRHWAVSVAIVDAGGQLIAAQRMDGASSGCMDVALGKARSAAKFATPTREFEEAIAAGHHALLSIADLICIAGGRPVLNGKDTIAAIGVSGRSSAEDDEIVIAALTALG